MRLSLRRTLGQPAPDPKPETALRQALRGKLQAISSEAGAKYKNDMKVKMLVGVVTQAFEAASDEQLEEMLRVAYDHISALHEVAYPVRRVQHRKGCESEFGHPCTCNQ